MVTVPTVFKIIINSWTKVIRASKAVYNGIHYFLNMITINIIMIAKL